MMEIPALVKALGTLGVVVTGGWALDAHYENKFVATPVYQISMNQTAEVLIDLNINNKRSEIRSIRRLQKKGIAPNDAASQIEDLQREIDQLYQLKKK